MLVATCIWQSLTIVSAAAITRSVTFTLENTPSQAGATRRLAIRRLNTAVRMEPDYAPAYYLLYQLSHDPAERLDVARHLTAIQPSDPRAFASLSVQLMTQGIVSEELTASLESARRVGPYDPISNQLVIDAGTRMWLRLTGDQRALVLRVAARAITTSATHQKAENLKLIEDRGFLGAVCSIVKEPVSACSGVPGAV